MAQNYERFLKRGDTGAPVRAHVTNESDGAAPNWTGATAQFFMWRVDPDTGVMSELVGAAAAIEAPDASSGGLRYDWQAGDTDVVGRHPAMFKVTKGGLVESYPSEGYIWINIEERG